MESTGVADLVQPLSARSIVASTLLGTYPPRLAGKHLVALGQRFGVSPGTTRVALSRMVERGELTNDDGVYALAGSLRERQVRQDQSRQEPAQAWDGTWEQAVVMTSGKSAAERTQLRRALSTLKLAELREGCWMRPANLDQDRSPLVRDRVAPDVVWFCVTLEADEHAAPFAQRLFPVDTWAARARDLTTALRDASGALTQDDAALVDGFMLAAAVLRHFVHDPQLPPVLLPAEWPAPGLLDSYNEFQAAYGQLLREFFQAHH